MQNPFPLSDDAPAAMALADILREAARLFQENRHMRLADGSRYQLSLTERELSGDAESISVLYPYRIYRELSQLVAHLHMDMDYAELDEAFRNKHVSAKDACKRAAMRVENPSQYFKEDDKKYAPLYLSLCAALQIAPAITPRAKAAIVDTGIDLPKRALPAKTGRESPAKAGREFSAKAAPLPRLNIQVVEPALDPVKVKKAAVDAYNRTFRPRTPTDIHDLTSHSHNRDITVPRSLAIYALHRLLPEEGLSKYEQIGLHMGETPTSFIDHTVYEVSQKIRQPHEITLRMLNDIASALRLNSTDWSQLLSPAGDQAPSSLRNPLTPMNKEP